MICQIFTTILVIKFFFLFIILVFVIFFMCTEMRRPASPVLISRLQFRVTQPKTSQVFQFHSISLGEMALPRNIFLNISINNTTNIPSGFHFQNQKSGIFKDFIRVCVLLVNQPKYLGCFVKGQDIQQCTEHV